MGIGSGSPCPKTAVCVRKLSPDSSVAETAMSNEILFYDISIQSPTHPTKCYAPNALYECPQNNRHLRLILRSDI